MNQLVNKVVEEPEKSRLAQLGQGWLADEGRMWGKALSNPALFGLLLAALLVLGLAWQVPFSYKFNPESQLNLDEPFLHNFNSTERTPADQPDPFHYRWSKGAARLTFPGIGKRDYTLKLRAASDPNPNPDYILYANETMIAAGRFELGLTDYTFEIPAQAMMGKNGDLELRFEMKPFQAKGDARELGFSLVSAELQPSQKNSGLVIPPPLQIGYLLAVIVLVYLICGRAGFSGGIAAGVGGFFALILAYVVATPGARIWLTLFTPQLAFAFGLALFFVVLADLPLRQVWGTSWERAWVLSIFGLALGIKLAGLLHPQAYLIDLGFHYHNFIALWENGEWFRKISSLEWGGRETYYPPTTYVFAGLFQWFISDKFLLLKVWMVVVESTRALLVYYLVKRTTGDGRAGIIAAFLMAVMPVGVISLSFGQVANLFGEWLMLAALCLVVVKYEQLRQPRYFAALTVVLLAAFVQHPGVILLSGTVFLLIVLVMRFTKEGRRGWGFLLACYLLALALSFGLYHWKTTQEMIPQAIETFNAKLQGQPTTDPKGKVISGWQVGGSIHAPDLGLEQERVYTLPDLVVGGLRGFWRETRAYFGVFPAVLAIFGLAWLWRTSSHLAIGAEKAQRRFFWILLAWLVTGVIFALVGLFLNLYVRYSLFLLPLVAVSAGIFLGRLWQRPHLEGSRWAVIALTVALGAYLTVITLAMFYDRIIYYGHGA
jgi:4-amino-4-deoxy-L-arabinose transferase-like glycosyltransferase